MLKKLLLLFILILLSSCSTSFDSVKSKLEPDLFTTVNEREMNGNYDYLAFNIVCKVEPGYEILNEIAITGANIIKHSGKVVTAIGTFEHVKKVAKLSFVERMQQVFGENLNKVQ